MQDSLAKHRIALLGIGHTNAHILKMWRMHAMEDTELVCVSNFRKATYSGMLPGVLAGQYEPSQMKIDLTRLCAAAGATLVIGDVTHCDPKSQRLYLSDHGPIDFDALSVGIGSVPTFKGVTGDKQHVVTIKPMQTFLSRLDARIHDAIGKRTDSDKQVGPLRIVIVGAGAGGAEIALCMPSRMNLVAKDHPFELTVVQSGASLVPGLLDSTANRVKQVLTDRGTDVRLGQRVTEIYEDRVVLTDGQTLPADVVVWATSAVANPVLANFGLPTDHRGFLATDTNLQCKGDYPIFAVGDSGTVEDLNLAKAGLYAVRQGPTLWDNLARSLQNRPLSPFRPQSSYLKLLNKGDGTAIGEYLGRSFDGTWAWKWKDYIDRKFMAMYQDYTPAMLGDEDDNEAMRCAGCGGKVGGSVLSAALGSLEIKSRPEVIVGLEKPDDAAVIQFGETTQVTFTTDFFKAPLKDAYLNGQIAALNALSDVWAMAARPVAALANIVLPIGKPSAQQRLLRELLEGSLAALNEANATLAGGHTIEGESLVIGFSIIAEQDPQTITTKADLKPGNVLLISKSLGTGILLAAHMQAECKAPWMKRLLRSLLKSNEAAANLAMECGASALTDVTGFGLAGHLLEMLRASRLSAEINLESLPLFDGVHELLAQGIESTLTPDNRAAAEPSIIADVSTQESAGYRTMFDPQTNGGMLIAMAPVEFETHHELLQDNGLVAIGKVVEQRESESKITCHV